MSNFSPSIHFAKRWLATPAPARSAIYDELDDIISLLDSEAPIDQFRFQHPDFYQAVASSIESADGEAKPNRLIHSIETTSLTADEPEALTTPDFDDIEARLNQSLATQIDEFLGEHMSQLSEDLRAWVQMAVRHELANHQRPEQSSVQND